MIVLPLHHLTDLSAYFMAYELSLSKKTDATGRSEIKLRLRLGKIDQQAATHLFVNPQFVRWETYISSKRRTSKRLVLVNSRNKTPEVVHTADVKERLDQLMEHLDSCIQTEGVENIERGWLATRVDEFIIAQEKERQEANKPMRKPRKKKTPSFFEYFDTFITSREISVSRQRHLKVISRILMRFELYKRLLLPRFTLSLDNIDDAMLSELEEYIKNEHELLKRFPKIIEQVPESREPGERGQNTVNGYFKRIKTFYLWAIEEGLTTNDPFRKYKISQDVYGTPYYITIEERHQIENADLSSHPRLEVQRDIFVFHCCIGCRVSDLRNLTQANVINGEVHYIARKTKAGHPLTIKVPLNQTALTILERYADPDRKALLPFISDQKYNDAIKEIFKLAGVTRNVVVRNSLTGEQEIRPINEIASSHMARRTFVGNIYKKFKDQSLVSELSGHAPNSAAFARYREVDQEMKREMVSAID